jgi:hypothetical protein
MSTVAWWHVVVNDKWRYTLPEQRITGPRYHAMHQRLRDTAGDFNLQAFRSQLYFICTTSQGFLQVGRFVSPEVSYNF